MLCAGIFTLRRTTADGGWPCSNQPNGDCSAPILSIPYIYNVSRIYNYTIPETMKKLTLFALIVAALLSCNQVDEGVNDQNLNLQLSIADNSRVDFVDQKYHWSGDETLGLYLGTTLTNSLCNVEVRDDVGHASVAAAEYQPTDLLYAICLTMF